MAARIVGPDDFLEIFVSTPLAECDKAGCSGASKGADIPVKFFISPRRALAYNPFTSRFSHSIAGNCVASGKQT